MIRLKSPRLEARRKIIPKHIDDYVEEILDNIDADVMR